MYQKTSNTTSDPKAKLGEIFIVWGVASLASYFVVKQLPDLDNIDYLKWIGISLGIWAYEKYNCKKKSIVFRTIIGRNLSSPELRQVFTVSVFFVLLGIGLWGVGVYLTSLINVDFAFKYWNLTDSSLFDNTDWNGQWIILEVFTGVILMPITEELIFRGRFLQDLASKYGNRPSIFISAFAFALMHINKNPILSLIHGLVLAKLVFKYQSLYSSVIIHIIYNGAILIITLNFGFSVCAQKMRLNDLWYWNWYIVSLLIGLAGLGICWNRFCLTGTSTLEPYADLKIKYKK